MLEYTFSEINYVALGLVFMLVYVALGLVQYECMNLRM